jgi:23S rRNA (adenine2503-C2)-methyltransferase
MNALNDQTLPQLIEIMATYDQKPYRAEQIYRWTANGATSFDELTNISKDLREKLSLHFNFKCVNIKEKFQSKTDETRKYLMELYDGELVESVLMSYKHGYSVCISSQVGCRMGCAFCASGKNGCKRNLSPAEMLGQIIAMQKDADVKVSNVVLMGIGEPLDNFENVANFIKIANSHQGLNIGIRHISLSTCGLIPQIYRLIEEKITITLSISLHATTDETRTKLMPINKKYPLNELIRACSEYAKQTGRRISFEYVLIKDVNDTKEDAIRLQKMLQGTPSHINLIPVNTIPGGDYEPSSNARVLEFRDWLMKLKVNTTIRRTLGADINAACGQLRGEKPHKAPDEHKKQQKGEPA